MRCLQEAIVPVEAGKHGCDETKSLHLRLGRTNLRHRPDILPALGRIFVAIRPGSGALPVSGFTRIDQRNMGRDLHQVGPLLTPLDVFPIIPAHEGEIVAWPVLGPRYLPADDVATVVGSDYR